MAMEVLVGGYGSSRWTDTITRATTDGLLRLDVHSLARDGCLTPGACATIAWHCGDTSPTITVQVARDDPHAITLMYWTQLGHGPRQLVRERVPLVMTPCHFGGERVWFTCPGCLVRCVLLYALNGRFRCRGCHHLTYSSTRR